MEERVIPQKFSEFRELVSKLLREHHPVLSRISADLDDEGSGVPEALFRAWQNFEAEMREALPSQKSRMEHARDFSVSIHDMVIDMLYEHENPMNHPPDGAPRIDHDPMMLARIVQFSWSRLFYAA